MSWLSWLGVVTVLTSLADISDFHQQSSVLWVATAGGLLRVEGATTRIFTPLDGLPDATVHSLTRLEDGLWVGTGRGLVRLNMESGELGPTLLAGQRVNGVARHQGALWVAAGSGAFRCVAPTAAPDDVACERVDDHLGQVMDILSTGSRLYVATAGQGVRVLRRGRFRRLAGDRLAWKLAEHNGLVWAATSRGLQLFEGARGVGHPAVRAARRLPVRDVRTLVLDGRGQPILGSYGGGAFHWKGGRYHRIGKARWITALAPGCGELCWASADDGSQPPALPTGLPDNDLSALARTSEGLWVGTFRAGLALIHERGITTFDERSGLVDNRINRLAVDRRGQLWVATDRGVLERSQSGFKLRGLLDEHVAMVATIHDDVYAAARGMLWRFDGERFLPAPGHPGRRIQDMSAHADTLLVATAEGLAKRTTLGWTLQVAEDRGLPDDWVTALATTASGQFAGFYNAGLVKLDGPRIEPILPDVWVNAGALAAFGPGLAVGTLDQGLWVYDGTSARGFTTCDGLPDDDVTDVLPDGQGGLWVATRGGLAHLRCSPRRGLGPVKLQQQAGQLHTAPAGDLEALHQACE